MDNNVTGHGGVNVVMLGVTGILWIFSRLDLQDWASIATIISASVVVLINLPRLVETVQKPFKRKP